MLNRWAIQSKASVFIALLIFVYILKQLFFVAAFYPFSGHDELAHFSYVRTLVTEARLPVIPDLHDWRGGLQGGVAPPTDDIPDDLYPYCRFALDWFCDPENPRWSDDPPRIVTVPGAGYFPSGYQYVANHPPLYYAIAAPIYALSSSMTPMWQQFVLRVLAIPFGLITVVAAYLSARVLFPGDTFLLFTAPTVVAFQPQISYEAAMVNNDIVAIAIMSVIILGMLLGIRHGFPRKLCVALGILLGLGLLTKGTTVAIIPVLGLALLWCSKRGDWRGLLERGIAMGVPFAVIASPWYWYLYRTYGDFSGLSRVSELQYWSQPMGSFFELLADPAFFADRFNESWGEYGWRLIHFETPLLWIIAVPLLIGGIGVFTFFFRNWRQVTPRFDEANPVQTWQMKSIAMLCLVVLVAYLAVVQFGTQFALAQARYYFPIVTAAALLILIGWRTLVPIRHRGVAQGLIVSSLVVLNVYIMVTYVLPFTSTFGLPVYSWYWGG